MTLAATFKSETVSNNGTISTVGLSQSLSLNIVKTSNIFSAD